MQGQDLNQLLINQLLLNQKRDRRWRNIRFFTRIFIFVLALFLLTEILPFNTSEPLLKGQHYVSLVRLNGVIDADQDFSAERVIPLLVDAFEDKNAQGVVLDINSGGGSAVQASIIYDRLLALKAEHPDKPVVVVGEDMLASGAYLIALAADKIYVNPNTITGSIGVVSKGFGFTGLIERVGVERRVFTAGANKDRLDPFNPLKEEDKAKLQALLTEVHGYFTQLVMNSRKDKLLGQLTELFSGDFWTGATALKLGLVDGTANLSEVLLSEFHVQHYRDYSRPGSLIDQLVKNISVRLDDYLVPKGLMAAIA